MYSEDKECTLIWKEYQACKDYHDKMGTFNEIDDCFRFYAGDQWEGINSHNEKLPQYNFIQPIVNYKTGVVAQKGFSINFVSMDTGEKYKIAEPMCAMLDEYFQKEWDRLKFDRETWNLCRDAVISRESWAYFFQGDDDRMSYRQAESLSVYLADEQETDVQAQEFVLIRSRQSVRRVREFAKKNGLSEDEINNIVSDEDTENEVGEKARTEVKTDLGKCTTIMKLEKKDGVVYMTKTTKDVVYHPEESIDGMKLYPLAHYVWRTEKGTARGGGDVLHLIPNQIEVNRALVRFLFAIKTSAFPHKIYDKAAINGADIDRLNIVGSNIGVDAQRMANINQMISYLSPPTINTNAYNIVTDMITNTKELAQAGEAATGQTNPEQASGAAIIAVQDANAMPLNSQSESFNQLIEDIAHIWFDMLLAYNPNGITFRTTDPQTMEPIEAIIMPEDIRALNLSIQVKVSQKNPYSKYQREVALQNLFQLGAINFEQYVDSLDDDSIAPKDKLEKIIEGQRQIDQIKASYDQLMQNALGLLQEAQFNTATLQQQVNDLLGTYNQLTGVQGSEQGNAQDITDEQKQQALNNAMKQQAAQ